MLSSRKCLSSPFLPRPGRAVAGVGADDGEEDAFEGRLPLAVFDLGRRRQLREFGDKLREPLQGRTGRPDDGTLHSSIVDFFEEGAAGGRGVLELIGDDVAAFCDDLIKDSRTYADTYQESISGKPGTGQT